MAKKGSVPRPAKKSDYEIRFATSNAARGWQDLVATLRNSMAETWDFLTATPTRKTETNYPLRDALGMVTREGRSFERRQHKPTRKGSARIWFYVDGQTVFLEQVHTHHPHETL